MPYNLDGSDDTPTVEIRDNNLTKRLAEVASISVLIFACGDTAAQEIDSSDPTKIYSFIGGGPKYTDYTNGEHMWEIRAIGNLALGPKDSILFELSYGWHNGDLIPGANSGLTNLRFRYFHVGEVSYDLTRGHRGMGYQVDMQFAGSLKGTDGQNVIVVGLMPVFALSQSWDLYMTTGLAGSWDNKFEVYNGTGIALSADFVYAPDGFWEGAQLHITPEYKYFLDQ